MPAREGLAIVDAMLANHPNESDPRIPWLIWWAIEAKAMSDTDLIVEMLNQDLMWAILGGSSGHPLADPSLRSRKEPPQDTRLVCECSNPFLPNTPTTRASNFVRDWPERPAAGPAGNWPRRVIRRAGCRRRG